MELIENTEYEDIELIEENEYRFLRPSITILEKNNGQSREETK